MLAAFLHIPQFIQLPNVLDFWQVLTWSHEELLEDRALLNLEIHYQAMSELVLCQ